LASFLEFGKVLGGRTLVRGINLLNAGLILRVDENGIVLKPGFYYGGQQVALKSREELEEEFISIAFEVFKEYIEAIRRENVLVVVPLSAGVDSRFVLSMIHTLGYKNIVTVTYGLKDAEYPVARKIAETLGCQNIFIEYTWELWRKYVGDMLDYMVWASQLFTTPNVQEYISTREVIRMCSEGLLRCDNLLLVVGDASNVILGKEPPPRELLRARTIEELVNFIFNKHILFSMYSDQEKTLLKKALTKLLNDYIKQSHGKRDFTTLYEIFH